MMHNLLERFNGPFFLRMLCAIFFLGKAWENIFWNANLVFQGIGLYFLALAIFIIFPIRANRRFIIGLLLFASTLLGSVSLFKVAIHQITVLQFFEDAIKILTPIILLQVVVKPSFSKEFKQIIKFSISLTFGAHGLYALGVFLPVPDNFIEMTVSILGVTSKTAYNFLFVVGILDLAIGIIVFIPKYAKYALGYAAFWGICTALARPLSQVGNQEVVYILHRWLFETIVRLPNAGIPLLILISEQKYKARKLKNKIEELKVV